ncbi:sarcosine oxidase subunit gamma [Aureimonas populi]|uniref:Sarcosine oxidase subunit gamma n=1 Tax=Aureimonas populi TaxID=1701758 RepID=A0ABW5CJY4_9HYPH|nr:sarcosine oxidase [Aureimonas populi]
MLKAFDPLDAIAPAPFAAPFAVRPAEPCARFSLRIDPASLAQASEAFGLSIPSRIGGVEGEEGRRAVCVGPDEWFLFCRPRDGAALPALFAALPAPLSLVEVSDRECALLVEGPRAAYALMAVCPLDLEAMAAGTATRTLFDKVAVLLVKETPERFRLEFWRSYAAHVHGLLETIGRELAAGL